jgi:hypothetical protein
MQYSPAHCPWLAFIQAWLQGQGVLYRLAYSSLPGLLDLYLPVDSIVKAVDSAAKPCSGVWSEKSPMLMSR